MRPAPVRLLLRTAFCGACGRPGVPELCVCPWCGERAPPAKATVIEFALGAAALLAAFAGAKWLKSAFCDSRVFSVSLAAAAGLVLSSACGAVPENGRGAESRSAPPLSRALAAAAAACMALFGASRADVFAFRFSWWRLALAGNLAAVSAYAAARCPALPPLGAALSATEKARTLALGTIPALLPLAAVAVPERGLCVLAVCALAHRAASFSGVMAIAYAVICTRFSPEPGAFATALCLFAAVSAFCPRLPGFFSPYGSSHQRRNFKSLPET